MGGNLERVIAKWGRVLGKHKLDINLVENKILKADKNNEPKRKS